MKPEEERAFVLHQFLALRRSGLPALDVLQRLVSALPEGAARSACAEAAQRLLAPESPPSPDGLVQVLSARGDDLGPAGALALAAEAELELSAARRSYTRLLQFCVAVPPPALLVLRQLRLDGELTELTLPAPSVLMYALADASQWVGVPLALVIIVLLERWRSGPAWGTRRLSDARTLFLAAASPAPTMERSLSLLEAPARALTQALAQRMPPAEAFVQVGRRLEREGRDTLAVVRGMATLVAGGAVLWFIMGLLTAAYLPLFSIAGGIK